MNDNDQRSNDDDNCAHRLCPNAVHNDRGPQLVLDRSGVPIKTTEPVVLDSAGNTLMVHGDFDPYLQQKTAMAWQHLEAKSD